MQNIEEKNKQFITINKTVFEIKSVIAFKESREDFNKHVVETVPLLKGKFDKIIVLGKVGGKVVQLIVCANKAGEILYSAQSK